MGRVSDAKERLMTAATELIWSSSYGSVTIDAICENASVKKGSFYYFFDSKSDLALAALLSEWEKKRPAMDALFSVTVPPWDRLQRFFEGVYLHQAELQQRFGRVLGCPLFTLGSEVCTQDARLLQTIDHILMQYVKYFESAIRDCHSHGLVRCPNATSKAKLLFAYFQGIMTQARIQNCVELIKALPDGARDLLGFVTEEVAAA
ncbi:MAG: TetR family transcriptional regulator [Verrucomicrobiales bacterium]|nr:TetR family transcriptional regulator [Verrucomicrobiales bacterium]MDB6128990.1 TetR family transcriptional regulator [Verrucomicrobiales bacterium]